jgi:hypothetical protein
MNCSRGPGYLEVIHGAKHREQLQSDGRSAVSHASLDEDNGVDSGELTRDDGKTQHRPVKGVVVMSPDGVVDEFESIDSAAATYGLSRTGIYHRIVRRNIDKDGTWLEYA